MKKKDIIPTSNINFFNICYAGCGGAGAGGHVGPCAVVNVLHLGFQLSEPQHDVIKQHRKSLLQICKAEIIR